MEVDHSARVPRAVAQGRIQKAYRNRKLDRKSQGVDSSAVVLTVSNLAPTVTSQDVADLFNSVGPTITAFVRYDREGKSKGLATVKYADMDTAQRAVKQFHSLTLDGQPLVVQIERASAQRRSYAAESAVSGSAAQTTPLRVPRSKKRSRGKSVTVQLPPVPAPTAEAVGGLRIVAGKGGVRDVLRVHGSSGTPERRRQRRRRRRPVAASTAQPMETESTTGVGAEKPVKGSVSKRTAKAPGRRRIRGPSRGRRQEKELPSKSTEELDRELDEYRMADN
jgi:RNA recognition motif-containing protein